MSAQCRLRDSESRRGLEAVRWLEKAVADHDGLNIAVIKVDPMLDPLRGDPHFEALVQKVVGPKQK